MMTGIGMAPESIENNPIVFDLMMENTWRGANPVSSLDSWVISWVDRRYYSSNNNA